MCQCKQPAKIFSAGMSEYRSEILKKLIHLRDVSAAHGTDQQSGLELAIREVRKLQPKELP